MVVFEQRYGFLSFGEFGLGLVGEYKVFKFELGMLSYFQEVSEKVRWTAMGIVLVVWGKVIGEQRLYFLVFRVRDKGKVKGRRGQKVYLLEIYYR